MALAERNRSFSALLRFAHAFKLDDQLQQDLHPGDTPADRQQRLQDHHLRIHGILARCPKPVQIWSIPTGAGQVRFSPQGTILATSNGHPNSPSVGAGRARLWNALTGTPRSALLEHEQPVHQLVFHRDGTLLATAASAEAGAGSARVWRTEDGAPAGPMIQQAAGITRVAFHPDGSRLLTASRDGSVRLWQIDSGQQLGEPMLHDKPVLDIAFNRTGSQLITAAGTQVRIWTTESGQPATANITLPAEARFCRFSARGGYLAASANGHLRYGRRDTPTAPTHLMGTAVSSPLLATAMTLDPLERSYAVGDEAGTIRIFAGPNTMRGAPFESQSETTAMQFSRNGLFLAAATRDGRALVLRTGDSSLLLPSILHPHAIDDLALSADGRYLVTTCQDKLVRVWDLAASGEDHGIVTHQAGITAARFTSDGSTLYTSSLDRTVIAWQLDTHPPLRKKVIQQPGPVDDILLSGDDRFLVMLAGSTAHCVSLAADPVDIPAMEHGAPIQDAHLDSSGTLLITASADRTAAVWELASGQRLVRLEGHASAVRDVAIDQDNNLVTTISDAAGTLGMSTLETWNTKSGKRVRSAIPVTGIGHTVRFLPPDEDEMSGQRVLVATGSRAHEAGTVRIYDLQSGEVVGQPMRHADAVTFMTLGPAGSQVLTTSRDATARIWDSRSGTPLTQPLEHPTAVVYGQIRADGRFLVTGCSDGSTYIWDIASGQLVQRGPLHRQRISLVQFHPNGQQVVSADRSGQGNIWTLTTDQLDPPLATAIAEALSGHQVYTRGDLVPINPDDILSEWTGLRDRQSIEGATLREQFLWLATNGVSITPDLWNAQIADMNQLVERNPADADLLSQRAYANFCADKIPAALSDLHASYDLSADLNTLYQYCHLAAFFAADAEYAAAIELFTQKATTATDKMRLLTAASLVPNALDDYAPLLEIADQLSTPTFIRNIYVRRAVGAIHLRAGNHAKAIEIFRGAQSAESRFVVPLIGVLIYRGIAEHQQGNSSTAFTLAQVASQLSVQLPRLEDKKPGPLWHEYLAHRALLKELVRLLGSPNTD
jgi:WD40 repeat protein